MPFQKEIRNLERRFFIQIGVVVVLYIVVEVVAALLVEGII